MTGARRLPAERGPAVTIAFDGRPLTAYAGETLAAALLADGDAAFGRTRHGLPRRPLCNMGTCYDCAVTVDGTELTRACLTPVAEGMAVETARSW